MVQNKSLQSRKNERKIDELERKLNFRKTFEATVLGAFTFVAGLFWRDVANGIVEVFLPQWSGLIGNLLTAIIVTFAFVMIAVRADSKTKLLEKELEKLKTKLDLEEITSKKIMPKKK